VWLPAVEKAIAYTAVKWVPSVVEEPAPWLCPSMVKVTAAPSQGIVNE
jgi:hypothetical protein